MKASSGDGANIMRSWFASGATEVRLSAAMIRSAARLNRRLVVFRFTLISAWFWIGLTACSSSEVMAAAPVSGTRAESHTISVGGMERSYLLYRPNKLPKGAPLVFLLHGFTDDNRRFLDSTTFNRVADANRFALCCPQGACDDQGRSFWETGYSFTEKYARDDVRFLKTLARELQKTHGFSKRNTFAAGMSNGAEMSILLGLHAPETFHAIAAVSGCVMERSYAAVKRPPRLPAFFINGDADTTTRWDGDLANRDAWGAYRPVHDLIALFTRGDQGLVKTTQALPDTDKSDRTHIVATRYCNAATGHQVWSYRIVGGGHDWPGSSGNKDIDAAAEIWRFFSQYVK